MMKRRKLNIQWYGDMLEKLYKIIVGSLSKKAQNEIIGVEKRWLNQGVVMRSRRAQYFMLICVLIILGLVSREISFVPLFVGDILWAIMIFFIIKFIFIDINRKTLFLVSLMICYMAEISQLYQVEWLNNIRMTTPGRLVLGQGFLWSDIISYTIGITIAATGSRVTATGLWYNKSK